MKKIRPYRRYSPEEKSKHIAAWRASGKSMVEYALGQNLNLYTFRLWATNARTRDIQANALRGREMRARVEAKNSLTISPQVSPHPDFSYKTGFKDGFELGLAVGRNSSPMS